ncbi:tyrosine-protein phosphatase [Nonomuraea jiangxiensis]|uniref:tyrosine-protein phosphatase n=1 Tax=Nonomuraea jiangxiensis TaxID=633440 RepID=UPI000B88EB47
MSDVESEPLSTDRHLDWDGCFNARDLGGIPVPGGGEIRRRAVIRSDNPERLTPRAGRPWSGTACGPSSTCATPGSVRAICRPGPRT